MTSQKITGGAWLLLACVCATRAGANMPALDNDDVRDLGRLSLDELAQVEVTSVSKSAQSLSTAPAAIFVITREDIRRSGVLTVPEALRLAPNMQVTQLTSSAYSNGARGFGGSPGLQNFSNKILILIDGRSVYSPIFSGVFYEAQDVIMDDIDRIEIISGPGATLWGANAMNGVINIITRSSRDTQGGLLRLNSGTHDHAISTRYGGSLGEGGGWRVYGKAFDRGSSEFDDGSSARDRWSKVQGGFRADFGSGSNQFTVQGDWQRAEQSFGADYTSDFVGANLVGRWTHQGARVETRLQFFYDHNDAGAPPEGDAYELDTLDFEIQQSADAGRHRLVWGVGHRKHDYDIVNSASLLFVPPSRKIDLTNIFIQDSIELAEHWRLIAGVKFEDSSFMDFEPLPELRLAWTPNERQMVWVAGSRAIRSPTPFDVDVEERVGGGVFLRGNPDFESEKVTAWEMGWRSQPHEDISFTAVGFFNEYDDLRTIEITPVTFLPLTWGNLMSGSAYGVEFWGHWQATSWWRLSPGFRSLHKRLHFKNGASQLLDVAQAGNDPHSQSALKSSMDFGDFSIDAMFRHVGALPDPAVDSYSELDARFAWRVSDDIEVAVTGVNLLHDRHREYASDEGRNLVRAVTAEFRWNF
jgi:iron complex outermembrane recepter protein